MSNFSIDQLEDLRAPRGRAAARDGDARDGDARDAPSVLQCEMHPKLRRDELRAYCAARGIVFQAYAPLGGPRARGALLGDATVRALARARGVSAARVLLRWGVQSGAALVTSSADPARARENARVWDFALDADEMERVRGLHSETHYYWDGSAVP